MFLYSVLLLVVLLPVCCLGPGFFLLRKLPWNPLEKLVAAVGLSLLLLYLYAFACFLATAPIDAYYAGSIVCLLLLVLSRRELAAVLRNRAVRRTLAAFGLLLLWCLLLLSLIRHFSGGGWFRDWQEHYDRTAFFLGSFPRDHLFLGIYWLPARPPLMNVVCAFFQAQVGLRYDLFELISLFLNALVFLSCALLARALGPRGGQRSVLWWLLLLFLASPVFVQNVTYTWTKLLAAFYVGLGLWLYRAGWQKQDQLRMVSAFASLAAGCLAHYSAAPFALFVGLHYLLVLWWRRRHRWRELLALIAVSTAILLTWFGWSIATYGLQITLASNTTVGDYEKSTLGTSLGRFGQNLLTTLIPHPLRTIPPGQFPGAADPVGKWRDSLFLLYQHCLTTMFGILGWLGVVYWWWQDRRRYNPPQRRFWLALVLVCFPLAVATHASPDLWGVGHVVLLPLVMIGFSFLAGALAQGPRWLVLLLVAGMVFDFAAGIMLHIGLENQEMLVRLPDGSVIEAKEVIGLSEVAAKNSAAKHYFGLVFWGDHFATVAVYLQAVLIVGFALAVFLVLRNHGRLLVSSGKK